MGRTATARKGEVAVVAEAMAWRTDWRRSSVLYDGLNMHDPVQGVEKASVDAPKALSVGKAVEKYLVAGCTVSGDAEHSR